MTSDNPVVNTELSKRDLLDLIDNELARGAEAAKVGGLTAWGLVGALGVVIVSIADLWSHGTPADLNVQQIALWFILLSFIWDQLSSRFRTTSSGPHFGLGGVRLQTLGIIKAFWPQFVVVFGRFVLILWTVIRYRAGVPWWAVASVAAYYAFFSISALGVAFQGARDFVMPWTTGGGLIARLVRKAMMAGQVLGLLTMVVGVAGYASALSLPTVGGPAGSTRLGALLAALAAVAEKLADRTSRSPVVEAFEELRRRTSFGTVSVEDGFAEAKSILYGSPADELLRKEVAEASKLIELAKGAEVTAASIAADIEQELPGPGATVAAINRAWAMRFQLVHQRELLASIAEQLDALTRRLKRHIDQVRMMDPNTTCTTEVSQDLELMGARTAVRQRLMLVRNMVHAADARVRAARRRAQESRDGSAQAPAAE